MYKLLIIVAVLMLTSFSFRQNVPKEELSFCDATKLVLKKMKAGEELTMKSWEVAEGADVFESNITIAGWVTSIQNNLNDFSFVARKGRDEDSLVAKTKFAEIRELLLNCEMPKKIISEVPLHFNITSGNIIIDLAMFKNPYKQYYLNFAIMKPKK